MRWLVVLLSIAATGCMTTVGGSGERDVAWSPDGALLAYARYDIGRDGCESSIWLRDVEDGDDRKLIDNGENPDWSPDGKRIAFVWLEYDGLGIGRGGIAVVNADGSNARRILSSHALDSGYACTTDALNDPAWSPDGRLIAYSDPSAPGIFVMRPDGSHRRRITSRYDLFPDWSPDGRQLVFVNVPRGTGEAAVTVVDRDGSGRRVVTNSALPVSRYSDDYLGIRPAWSPLGARIAYPSFRDIALVDRDGEHATSLDLDCGDGGGCWSPAWSPDGSRIAYSGANQRIEFADVATRTFPCLGGETSPLTTREVVTVLRRNGFSVGASAKLADCTAAGADPITAYVITNKGHERVEGELSCELSQNAMWRRDLDLTGKRAKLSFANIYCNLYPRGSLKEVQVMRFERAARQLTQVG
jgi:dipeptidyl aminopeptidase/acylaminoacyl peptidase